MKHLFACCLLLLASPHLRAQSSDEQQVRQVLARQVEFWNKGDIDNFMTGYWNSDSVLFVGRSGPTYGYQNTLENYKKGYPTKEAMGILTFNLIEVKRLSLLHFFVLGKFHLERTIGDAEGYFTLVFKKIHGKWVIVSDHSS